MKINKMPYGFDLNRHFPDMRREIAFEGGAIYTAKKDDKFYAIANESTMADFLLPEDEDLLDELIKVYEFDTEKEREQFLKKYKQKTSKHEF